MKPEHILGVRQFNRSQLDALLLRADELRNALQDGGLDILKGKILATVFYEPSTRTRLSFESAMFRLGGQVISSEMAAETSSAAKGESIEDTVRIIESYADGIVIRHPVAGEVDRAAAVAKVPVINAGDGANEHPTQALLDLYTLKRELGRIDNLNIALVGDLRYGRAPRSLAVLLTQTTVCKLLLVAPEGVEINADILAEIDEAGIDVETGVDLNTAASEADAIYVTRVQRERFPDEASYLKIAGQYQFTTEHLGLMSETAVVMHPLPRLDEIHPDVDVDGRAAYFRQAENGVYVRMALLERLLTR